MEIPRIQGDPTRGQGAIVRAFKIPQRNAPCICKSGKKFKKCCYNDYHNQNAYSYNEIQFMKAREQAMSE